MCRMRETNYGSVPAECFGPSMARRVRPLLRLQNHVAGQVFLQGSEAILQRGFLQVSNRSYQLLHLLFFFFSFLFPREIWNDGKIVGYLSLTNLERDDIVKTCCSNRRISNDIIFFLLMYRYVDSHPFDDFFMKNRNESYHCRYLNILILKIETLHSNQSCNSNSNRTVENWSTTLTMYIYTRKFVRSMQGVKSCRSKQYEQVRAPLVSNSSTRTCPSSSMQWLSFELVSSIKLNTISPPVRDGIFFFLFFPLPFFPLSPFPSRSRSSVYRRLFPVCIIK